MKQNTQNTIIFIPDRLNRRPVVFKGLTVNELFLLLGIGVATGIAIGVFLSVILGWDMVFIPILGLLFSPLFVWVGSRVLIRLKRGKPEGWLERVIELKTNSAYFITSDQRWSIKRSPKALKRSK